MIILHMCITPNASAYCHHLTQPNIPSHFFFFFFFNDTATTEIYTLSLHDALPISSRKEASIAFGKRRMFVQPAYKRIRSEEHTSELQSQSNLVCRLLLEKKKKKKINNLSH